MNCPTCHQPILAELLACPVCAERKSMAALLEQAKYYVPDLISGTRFVVLRRSKTDRGGWHVELASRPHVRTFCGIEVHPKWPRLVRYWDEVQRLELCGCCSDALARLAQEIEHARA